jgi:imidazolonepropionase-like amidohydrolase
MALHRQAGIPAWAVLRTATSDAARELGIGERVGRLAAGHEADILFLGADPRPDLSRLAEVRAMVDDGELLSPERLRRGAWAKEPVTIRASRGHVASKRGK